MGGALARLVDIPSYGSELSVLDPPAFGDRYAERIRELGERLEPLAASGGNTGMKGRQLDTRATKNPAICGAS